MHYKYLIFFAIIAAALSTEKLTPEEEIAEETLVLHLFGYHEKLEEMEEITNEIAFRIHSYHQVFSAFGDVAHQIDFLHASLLAIRKALKDKNDPSLDRFKTDAFGEPKDWYEARKDLIAEELRKMKRAIRKIEKMLPGLEGYDDFKMGSRTVYKKLDQEKHAIEEMEKIIEDEEYIPKKSIITMEMERQQRRDQIYNKKTIVKPAAAKVSSPVKEKPAVAFKNLMKEFDKEKIPLIETISNLENLFTTHSKFTPDEENLEQLFAQIQQIIQFSDDKGKLMQKTLSLLTHFTKNKIYHSMIFQTDIMNFAISLLYSLDDLVVELTLDNFINIAETPQGIKHTLDSLVLKFMEAVFKADDEELSYKSLQLLSKLTAADDTSKKEDIIKKIYVQDKNLFSFMVNHLNAAYLPSRIPAFISVTKTLEHGNSKLIGGMIDMGFVCDLCKFFRGYSGKYTTDTFKALKNTLEKSGTRLKEVTKSIKDCGGYDYITKMETKESKALIKKYF